MEKTSDNTGFRIRRSADRGYFDHGWLKTYHSFSFGDYFDRRFLGYRSLRVLNEDFIDPAQGFGAHPHRDMEILTYVLSGALEHRDSMGHGSVIQAGDVQYMSAGSGVTHSEANPSETETVHLLQIWIKPSEVGASPRYGQLSVPESERKNQWRLVASPDAAEGSIAIRQNARMWVADLESGRSLELPNTLKFPYLHVATGGVKWGAKDLSQGDAAYDFERDSENGSSITAVTEDTRLVLFGFFQ